MDSLLATIDAYDEQRLILLKEYLSQANNRFGTNITISIHESFERIINTDKNIVERYLKLYDYYKTVDDKVVKEMIFEKLEDEYSLILDMQRDEGVKLKFNNPDNMCIETLLTTFEKISNFVHNDRFKTEQIYKSLLRIQEVHKIHHGIFTNMHESSKQEEYDQNVFKLTDDEILARNEEILGHSNNKFTNPLDIQFNNIKLNDVKCFNE
jgi:hypothetical protein